MSTEFPNMSVEESTHISAFIATFVVKPKRGRWRTILAMKPEKWLGVSAYDCTEEPAADWNTPVADTLAKHNLTSELDRKAYVFPIGHGAGAPPYEATLRGVLLSLMNLNLNVLCHSFSESLRCATDTAVRSGSANDKYKKSNKSASNGG